MFRSGKKITSYFYSEEFHEDRKRLESSTAENTENLRLVIITKWSENLIDLGGFPSLSQSEELALFVIGEISLEQLVACLDARGTIH